MSSGASRAANVYQDHVRTKIIHVVGLRKSRGRERLSLVDLRPLALTGEQSLYQ
jgi:hypothetical protein